MLKKAVTSLKVQVKTYCSAYNSPVKLNFDLEQIATEFILMACDSTCVST